MKFLDRIFSRKNNEDTQYEEAAYRHFSNTIESPNFLNEDGDLKIPIYTFTEIVAVPEGFEIESYLKMRERLGIFPKKEIKVSELKTISEAVKYTPILSFLNNVNISVFSCVYYLSILTELGLSLTVNKSVDYEYIIQNWKEYEYQYLRTAQAKVLNIVIVNIVPLVQDEVIDSAKEAIKKITNFQNELKEVV